MVRAIPFGKIQKKRSCDLSQCNFFLSFYSLSSSTDLDVMHFVAARSPTTAVFISPNNNLTLLSSKSICKIYCGLRATM